jgi:hypothetical protein
VGNIRIVGRARGGRCVFCHDSLGGDVDRCGGCGATWHSDCGAAGCPTIGCSRPAPDAQQRAASPTAEPVIVRGKPGLAARVGPYTRLVASALFNAAIVTAVLFAFGWIFTHPSAFWEMLLREKRGTVEPAPLAVLKGLAMLVMPGVCGWLSGRWLLRLPAVWRELGQLLESTTPAAMLLRIYSSGQKKKTWYAALHPPNGGKLDALHTIKLEGILPPLWLRWQDDKPVLVYGLPPPGPYVFEFEDGWLALVHPDED